ncbi:hypothetical protein [Streptacidiphilus sp. PAMC 29251]
MDEVPGGRGIQDSEAFAAFVRADKPVQLFAQFFDDPFGFIRERVAGHLEDREAGALLSRLTLTETPVPRGDGHLDYDDLAPNFEDRGFVLTRVALFVPFTARVQSPSKGVELVQGALTCVVGNVNQPDNRVVQSWMDVDDLGLNRLLAPDTKQYQTRMLSVGRWLPSDYPPGSPEREGRQPV